MTAYLLPALCAVAIIAVALVAWRASRDNETW